MTADGLINLFHNTERKDRPCCTSFVLWLARTLSRFNNGLAGDHIIMGNYGFTRDSTPRRMAIFVLNGILSSLVTQGTTKPEEPRISRPTLETPRDLSGTQFFWMILRICKQGEWDLRIFHEMEDFEEETSTNWTWEQDGLIRETIIQSLRRESTIYASLS